MNNVSRRAKILSIIKHDILCIRNSTSVNVLMLFDKNEGKVFLLK